MKICDYTVLPEALQAILIGEKTVEIRIDNQKRVQPGDIIHFHELNGDKEGFAWVEKVEFFDNIDVLLQVVDEDRWKFEPSDTFKELVHREFYTETYGKPVKAIYFHLISISVIMPCYNVFAYIEETLCCLKKQTFQNFELIIMDDGSTDSTSDIIQKYRNIMPIRYIENKHSGPAKLRTEGMKLSLGKYIIFLDSDDLFEPEYLQMMYETLECSGEDIALGEYDSFISDEGYHNCPIPAFENSFVKDNWNKAFSWENIPDYLMNWTNVPWNKMYRKSFLDRIDISFQDLPCSNDVYFSHISMMRGTIIHIATSKAMIHYRIGRTKSISQKHDFFSEIKAYEKILAESTGESENVKNKILNDFVFGIMKCIRWGSGVQHRTFYAFIKKEILFEHNILPQKYLEDYHPWLGDIFKDYNYNDTVFHVNYAIIVMAHTRKDELQQLFEKLATMRSVGTLYMNHDLRYLRGLFEKNAINWVVGEECKENIPQIMVCLSVMHLTEMERFRREQGLSEVGVLPIFCI